MVQEDPWETRARAAEYWAAELARCLADVVAQHATMHHAYGNTTACWGGIGGQTITMHCAHICDNPKHEQDQEAWHYLMSEVRTTLDAVQANPNIMAKTDLRQKISEKLAERRIYSPNVADVVMEIWRELR